MPHKARKTARAPNRPARRPVGNAPAAAEPRADQDKPRDAGEDAGGQPVVVRSHNSNFGIQLAVSPTHATLLHFSDGPFQVQVLANDRGYQQYWKPVPDVDAKSVAMKWLKHPLGIALRGSDEALDAIVALAHDEEWSSRKVVKVEKQAQRAGQPSSVAREIIKNFDYTNSKSSKPIYEACEKAGINRKLAASVLCNLRKKLK